MSYMCSTKQEPQMNKGSKPKYSERLAVREISKVSRPHDGCNNRTVNTQQDLSGWQTMYHIHGYHPWDHSATLRLTQSKERSPVKEVQRGLLWRNSYSSAGTTELLQGLWSLRNAPRAFSSGNLLDICCHLLNISVIIILQKRRRQALFRFFTDRYTGYFKINFSIQFFVLLFHY